MKPSELVAKMLFPSSALLLLVLLSGCITSVCESSPALCGQLSEDERTVVTNLKVENTGFYLFYWIPLVSGSASYPNHRAYELFQDELSVKNLLRMLDDQCCKDKADEVVDIQIQNQVTGWIGLGIVWKKTMSASAVAVKSQERKSGKSSKHGKPY